MKRFLIPMVSVLVLLVCGSALAAVPQTISYQGVLTDGAGNIVADGNYSITFRIYDDPNAGTLLWTEPHPVVAVSKGGFSVILGSSVPIIVRFNAPMWLELQVAPDPPLTPRAALTSSPYALNARNVFDGGSNNFVGIGRPDPVTLNESFGVLSPTTNDYGGMYVKTLNGTSKPFYGYEIAGTAARTWTYVDGADGFKWKLNHNGDDLVTVTNTGNVGIGTTSPGANLDVTGTAAISGTTTLGAAGPAIKMLKFTGTTAAGQGGSVSVATGIPTDKILSVTAMVQYAPGDWVCPSYTYNPGYEFNWYVAGSSIFIVNKAANSSIILSQPFKLLVTYEE